MVFLKPFRFPIRALLSFTNIKENLFIKYHFKKDLEFLDWVLYFVLKHLICFYEQVKYFRGSKIVIFTSPVLVHNAVHCAIEILLSRHDIDHDILTIGIPHSLNNCNVFVILTHLNCLNSRIQPNPRYSIAVCFRRVVLTNETVRTELPVPFFFPQSTKLNIFDIDWLLKCCLDGVVKEFPSST